MKKVVLAYSGGLDTSVAVAWLREQFGAEVVTLTVDVGGGSLGEGVERRAMSAGASRAYVVEHRDSFERAGQAVLAKIMSHEGAAKALQEGMQGGAAMRSPNAPDLNKAAEAMKARDK